MAEELVLRTRFLVDQVFTERHLNTILHDPFGRPITQPSDRQLEYIEMLYETKQPSFISEFRDLLTYLDYRDNHIDNHFQQCADDVKLQLDEKSGVLRVKRRVGSYGR